MYFSCVLQEKYQKKQAKGALNARSSRTGAAPFGNPRRASPLVPEHLNLNPVQAENVPIFCLKFTSVNIGRAAKPSAAANSKAIHFKTSVVKVLGSCGGAAG